MNSNYDEIQDKKADDHCRLMQKQREKKTETVVFAGGQSYEVSVREKDNEE